MHFLILKRNLNNGKKITKERMLTKIYIEFYTMPFLILKPRLDICVTILKLGNLIGSKVYGNNIRFF